MQKELTFEYGNNVIKYYKRLFNFHSNFTSPVRNVRYILVAKNMQTYCKTFAKNLYHSLPNKPNVKCLKVKNFLEQAVKILCNSWKSTQFCVSWYNQFLFWLLRIKRKVCSAINFCTLTRGEPFSSFWGEIYKDIHIECSKQFE